MSTSTSLSRVGGTKWSRLLVQGRMPRESRNQVGRRVLCLLLYRHIGLMRLLRTSLLQGTEGIWGAETRAKIMRVPIREEKGMAARCIRAKGILWKCTTAMGADGKRADGRLDRPGAGPFRR